VKNPELLIEIARITPEFYFTAFGDGAMMDELAGKAPANLRFMGWQDSSLVWSIGSVAVSTSKNEGISNALLEAASIGIPIVANNISANSETLQNCTNYCLVGDTALAYSEGIRLVHLTENSGHIRLPNSNEFPHDISKLYFAVIRNDKRE
jgi:glycosyltransferase involved in cell wall biosynthesis